MDFPLSQGFANELVYLPQVDSTNLELGRRVGPDSPEFSVIVAGTQTAGRGRLGRNWTSEPGTSLSASILLKPEAGVRAWVTLLAGVAMARALKEFGLPAKVKWPNDVLIEGKKICGILAELRADGSVILGVGLNLKTQAAAPETATSLQSQNLEIDLDSALAYFLAAFRSRYTVLTQSPQFAITKTLGELDELCSTLGTRVRAEFPDGKSITGLASSIDRTGQLVIQTPEPIAVSAADVWHLRN